jgi:hypothetical protein
MTINQLPQAVIDEAWSEFVYPRAPVGDLARPSQLGGFNRAMRVVAQWVDRRVAAELDRLADEMYERPGNLPVTAEDVRARAAQLRSEPGWCNCQAVRGTANYPGPWHPKGDPTCISASAR